MQLDALFARQLFDREARARTDAYWTSTSTTSTTKDMRRLLQGYTEARRAGRFARPGSEVLAELRRAIEVH